MNSCDVETINAIWTAIGLAVTAITILYSMRRITRDWDDESAIPAMLAAGIIAAIVAGVGSYHGQQAIRYGYASGHGYECEYRSGNVQVVKRVVKR